MEDYRVRLLSRMLRTYSTSGNEKPLAALLKAEMGKLGFAVGTDRVGNVLGTAGRTGYRVLLCGHMDTVSGWIPVKVAGGKIFGRGAVDAKGPLASLILAASQAVRKAKLRVQVAAVVDEEGTGRGIRHIASRRRNFDYAVFGEPSGIDSVIVGYKGRLLLTIECSTESGHAAASWLYHNAIEKAFEIWYLIRNLHFPWEKASSRFHSTTSTLIGLEGGGVESVTPGLCRMRVDIRVPPSVTCRQIVGEVRRILQSYAKSNPQVKVRFAIDDFVPPYEANQDSLLVSSFTRAIRLIRGTRPTLLRKTGTGDMNVLGKAYGIPVLTYGPGDSRLDHTVREHLDINEYLQSIDVLTEALENLATLTG